MIYFIYGLFAYLVGAIPTSVWVSRYFFGFDIREKGSGNAGATNTMRVLGGKVGVPVLVFDIFKGFIVVFLCHWAFNSQEFSDNQLTNIKISYGLLAVLGHIFPIYVGFRGGKGVATLSGMVLGISPLATLIAIGVFIIMLLISKYVSVSSMIAGLSYPLTTFTILKSDQISLEIFSIFVAFLLIFTHRKNIARLRAGTESKVGFLQKRK